MKAPYLVLWCILLVNTVIAAEQAATSIALLDISKSVSKQEFENARRVLAQLHQQESLAQNDLRIYLFGNSVKEVDVTELLTTQPADSHTALYDAVYDAAQAISASPVSPKTLVVFSDGKDTKSAINLDDVVSYANQHGIVIHAVAFGEAKSKSFARMVKLTRGRFFDAADPDLFEGIRASITPQSKAPVIDNRLVASKVAQPVVTPVASVVSRPRQLRSSAFKNAGLLAVASALMVIAFVAFRKTRSRRTVMDSEMPVEHLNRSYSNGAVPQTTVISSPPKTVDPERTEDLEKAVAEKQEWKQDTQEIMSQTYVLIEYPVLVMTTGENRGHRFFLDAESPVSIGRSRVNEIRLNDNSISAQHCRIIPENGRNTVYDLDSTNGTFVNNERVSKMLLEDGDTLKVGETEFLYRVEQTRMQ